MANINDKINTLSPEERKRFSNEVYNRMNDRDWFIGHFPKEDYCKLPLIIKTQILEITYQEMFEPKGSQAPASP
jgi:hypothetical protein